MTPMIALGLPYPFDREYMQLALLAGIVVGTCAPLIGVFLVQKRLSLMGDGIGHLAFAGVAAGLLLDVAPIGAALAVAVAGSLLVEWLRARGKATGDLALALVFYGGIAAAVVLTSRARSGSLNVLPYLFGSLLTVSPSDARLVVGLGIVIVVTLAVIGRALFAIVLDEESARVAGLPVAACNATLAVLTAVTVVAAMRVVGVLLVAAMMVLPVATSRTAARSFRATVVGGVVAGLVSVVAGLAAAREWGLAPGGSIVLTAAGLFLAATLLWGRRAGREGAPAALDAAGVGPRHHPTSDDQHAHGQHPHDDSH